MLEIFLGIFIGFVLAYFSLRGLARVEAFFIARKMKKEWEKRREKVLEGKIFEHLVPFSDFPFHPRDARFIGDPVDFIVFDGLHEGKDVRIYFVEVKKGGKMNENEKRVKEAVEKKRVFFKIIQ